MVISFMKFWERQRDRDFFLIIFFIGIYGIFFIIDTSIRKQESRQEEKYTYKLKIRHQELHTQKAKF